MEHLKKDEVSLGTTVMAVEYDGGVVIGADSRTTTGSYIPNRVTDKLTLLHETIFCCRSGSAADTQAVSDIVKYNLELYSLQIEKNPDVSLAANLCQNICYKYKSQLLAGLIVAGWDERNGGSVYTIPLGGSIHKQPFSIGGSGSTYIYGYCDLNFKQNMSREECHLFVKNSLSLAMARDGSSGGVIRIAEISKEGVKKIVYSGDEIPSTIDF